MRHVSICVAAALLLACGAAAAQKPDAADMEKCAGDWEAIHEGLKKSRQTAERRRSGAVGEPDGKEKKAQAAFEESMARFQPACGKYGFQPVGADPRAELNNNRVAKELRVKTGTKRP